MWGMLNCAYSRPRGERNAIATNFPGPHPKNKGRTPPSARPIKTNYNVFKNATKSDFCCADKFKLNR
jgi:hypothetical protein